MFCSKCGVSAVSQQVFCSSCGNRLIAQSQNAFALNYPSSQPGLDLDERNAPAPMNLVETIKFSYKNYARFSGRASRSEYWYWSFYTSLGSIILLFQSLWTLFLIERFWRERWFEAWKWQEQYGFLPYCFFALTLIIPYMARATRRLHDTNRSGGFLSLLLLPFVGPILLLVYFCTDGDAVPNRYGPPSKRFQKI